MSPRSISGGWVEVVTGCMFSGKTEELIRRLERAEIAGQRVKVFKPEIDDRYGEEEIGSHRGSQWSAELVSTDEEGVGYIRENAEGDVIAIDEANFFENKLIEICQELADNGYRVIVSGIDQTYRGDPFEPVPQLISIAEYVDKLRAICQQCGEPATRNQRLIDGEPAHADEPTIVVGADEKYEARCRDCHKVKKD